MRKKILFIIPSLEIGGTVSSLNSIYKEFSEEYDISVLPLASTGNASVLFSKNIIPTLLLTNYYLANFKDLNTHQKILAFTIKIIKRFCHIIDLDILSLICKQTMKHVERRKKYDIVVGFQEGIATLVASYSEAKKKIAWVHCNYKYYVPECKEENRMYSTFDNIICVSSFTAESFKEIMSEQKSKVSYIYNIFNENTITDRSNEYISDKRFDNSCVSLLSIGRICEIKRFSMIPKIAYNLKQSNINFKWYIIGPVSQEKEFEKLNQGIEHYNLQDCVTWLGYKTNPYPFLRATKLLICLSLSEACPMVFNEAIMLGTPIISTDFGSAYEFIKNGENGFICTIDEVFVKIKEYIEDTNIQNNFQNKLQEYISPNPAIISSLNSLFN